MSEQNMNRPTENPTDFDLHRVQASHGVILEGLRDDVKEIKEVFLGGEKGEGLIIDVDRLKRSRALFHAVLWAVFITTIGTSATVIVAQITK